MVDEVQLPNDLSQMSSASTDALIWWYRKNAGLPARVVVASLVYGNGELGGLLKMLLSAFQRVDNVVPFTQRLYINMSFLEEILPAIGWTKSEFLIKSVLMKLV